MTSIDELKDKIRIKNNESDEEYELRICALHDEYDLSWDDIAYIINAELGQSYTESRYRKMWKAYCIGVKSTDNKQSQSHNNDSDSVEMNNDKENELREWYASTSDKLSYLRELRQDSRFERFYKYVGSAIEKIGRLDVPLYLGTKTPKTNKKYLMPLADLHLGANFESVNNKYSIQEVKHRIELIATYVRDFVKEKGIKEITVLSLGDLIQGILRISDLKLNEKDVSDSFVYAIRLIAGFLNTISAYCYVNYIHVCYSNHEQSRYLGSKASELAGEDLGKISFAYLQDVLSYNPRIKVIGDPTKDYYEFNIFNFECFAAHGHQIKNINDVGIDLSNRHRKFYDYVFLAHSHSAKELISAEGKHHDIETLVAPSVIGSDPYADKLFVGSKAAIKIFGFDEKYGHTESYKFILN